jgi:hypothetical protein
LDAHTLVVHHMSKVPVIYYLFNVSMVADANIVSMISFSL